MFCTSLRQRTDLEAVIPILLSPQGLHLKESSLLTHDLALPVPNKTCTHRLLLLLNPNSIEADAQPSSLSRISRLTTLEPSNAPAIAFLLTSPPRYTSPHAGLRAYMELQILLLDLPAIPTLIPIASPECLQSALTAFVSAQPPRTSSAAPPTQLSLLPHTTSTAPGRPLSEHTTNVLSDLCHSLGDVADTVCQPEGRIKLEDWIDVEEVKAMEEFWTEEWIWE